MEQKSIKKNYIYNTCYQILTLITPLITTPYVSRVLGADGIGTVSYAESIVSYFVLFATMGVATYGQREISYVQNSIEKRSIVFWNTKIFTLVISSIVLLIYVGFAATSNNPIIYYIFTFNILAVLVDVTWFFQGMECFDKIVVRNVIIKILNVIYIFAVIKSQDDLLKYVFGIAFFTFITNISLWWHLPQFIKRIDRNDLHPFKDAKVILALFVPTIAIQIYTVLDKTMIGIITQNAFENGYYEQALKIARMVLMLVASLGTVMVPRIGYHFQRQETQEVQRLIYRSYRFVWLLGIPLCFGLIMVSDNFVPWFFGTGYEKVSDLLKVLSFIILAIGINNVGGMQYLIPTKREDVFTKTVLIGAGTNFILNIILIPQFQSIGAAIASVMAEVVIVIAQFIFIRKEISALKVLKEGLNYYIAGALMTVVLWIVGKQLSASIINTAILVILGASCYFVCLIVLKDEFFVSNIKNILKKLKVIK